jgi:hypothetical protein
MRKLTKSANSENQDTPLDSMENPTTAVRSVGAEKMGLETQTTPSWGNRRSVAMMRNLGAQSWKSYLQRAAK